MIAIYEHDGANAVAKVLANAIRTSTIQIDKASAKDLKAGWRKHRPGSQAEPAGS